MIFEYEEGPAFIRECDLRWFYTRAGIFTNVPSDYIWQDETVSTIAGWVRPKAKSSARDR